MIEAGSNLAHPKGIYALKGLSYVRGDDLLTLQKQQALANSKKEAKLFT